MKQRVQFSSLIYKSFLILELLSEAPRSRAYLAERMQLSPRTIYRYIKLLNEVGFCVEMDFDSRYYLTNLYYPQWINKLKHADA